jgi:hypothetical protein
VCQFATFHESFRWEKNNRKTPVSVGHFETNGKVPETIYLTLMSASTDELFGLELPDDTDVTVRVKLIRFQVGPMGPALASLPSGKVGFMTIKAKGIELEQLVVRRIVKSLELLPAERRGVVLAYVSGHIDSTTDDFPQARLATT